jgi:HK97 family phage major capsid protein
MNILILKQRKAAAIAAAKGLNDVAAAADRDLTADELSQYDAHMAEAAGLQARIERAEALAAADVSGGFEPAAGQRISVDENVENDPKRGFRSMGDFLKSVYGAAMVQTGGGAIDKRLVIGAAAPSTFAGEGAGQDGGFLIPPEFSKEVFTFSMGDQALLQYTDEVNVTGNSMGFPRDETTPWGTNGIRAYWQGEAGAGAAGKPVLGLNTLRLKKLMALVPVSDEMLEDAVALNSYLPKKMGQSIQWKANESILFGAGNGQPAGALVAGGAVVTVAKDSGQAANTLTALNLANMIARLPEGSFPNAVWIINNDVLPALFTLTLGNYPIYLPAGTAGGIQNSPYGTLLGRPVLVSQHANTFSSQGDVILVDLRYYQTITKAGGIQLATSMHLYFDADAAAFRTTFRMDGQSKITAPIAPAKGSNKLSPFVQLAAR